MLFLLLASASHDSRLPINQKLGVPGFPDCVRAHPGISFTTVEAAADDLVCMQRPSSPSAVKIGCIGDSITAGVHSSGGDHPYPQQLQLLLDAAHGRGAYSVTNLGACGSTMLKKGNSPFWKRPQYTALLQGRWDIITIMLGTNDAKDPGSHGPDNWQHDCGGVDHTTVSNCSFASDFHDMIELVKTLGTTPGVPPKIHLLIPPPLMAEFSIGANQTVINSVYPKLVPLIAAANQPAVVSVIDLYTAMGGEFNWQQVPAWPKSCELGTTTTWPACGWWCDQQSCDQCHPNDSGYEHIANVLKNGLGL